MKKYYILIFILLLLTGCKATATISIDKNTITETVKVSEKDNKKYNSYKNWNGFPVPLYYDQELEAPLWVPKREKEDGVLYYDVNSYDQNHTIITSGKFNLNNHNRSSLVRNCFKLYNVISKNNKTIFSTSKGLICAFKQFDIIVTTPYTVTSHNASKVDTNTNTYTWNINNSNVKTASVFLEVDFSKKYNEKEASNNKKNNTSQQENIIINNHNTNAIGYIIIVIIIVAIIIMGIYLYKRKGKVSSL